MDFAQTIKTLREKLFLSQSEFAERLGVSFATVNRWENDKHEPTYKKKRIIIAMCKKHGIKTEGD